MTFWLTSRLTAFFAKTIALARPNGEPPRTARKSGSAPATWTVVTAASGLPTYVIATSLAADATEWSVFNSISNRIVVTGLSRRRAATLCETLNLACAEQAHLPSDAEHRNRSPRRER